MKVGKEVHSFRNLTTNISKFKVRGSVRRRLPQLLRLGFLATILCNILFLPINITPTLAVADAAQSGVEVWWPTEGAHMQGTQPFKAMVQGLDVSNYDMSW